MSSPCHHCPKCPCKEHDTCKDYKKYRAELVRKRNENKKTYEIKDYVNRSIDKRKRRERYK
jgi:hypothetical protein